MLCSIFNLHGSLHNLLFIQKLLHTKNVIKNTMLVGSGYKDEIKYR